MQKVGGEYGKAGSGRRAGVPAKRIRAEDFIMRAPRKGHTLVETEFFGRERWMKRGMVNHGWRQRNPALASGQRDMWLVWPRLAGNAAGFERRGYLFGQRQQRG